MNHTLEYYNQNANEFVQGTVAVDFRQTQNRFLAKIPAGAYVLDFGCGSGRDTKYFLEQGYRVDAIDGSAELCKMASEYTGICVKQMLFEELDEVSRYDGIWACSSILHLSKSNLRIVLEKMVTALKQEGIIYTSFKYGDFEGERNGRYFTDFTLENFQQFLENSALCITIEDAWVTGDVRPGKENEQWLNVILHKEVTQ